MENVQRIAKETMRSMENMKIVPGKPIFLSLGFLPGELKIRGSFGNIEVKKEKVQRATAHVNTVWIMFNALQRR